MPRTPFDDRTAKGTPLPDENAQSHNSHVHIVHNDDKADEVMKQALDLPIEHSMRIAVTIIAKHMKSENSSELTMRAGASDGEEIEINVKLTLGDE